MYNSKLSFQITKKCGGGGWGDFFLYLVTRPLQQPAMIWS